MSQSHRALFDSLGRAGRFAFLLAVLTPASLLVMARAPADTASGSSVAPVERWYSSEHVQRGAVVYNQYCVVCHGERAEGTKNWRQRGADGKFPPPPIDGTGHAWHHPIKILGAQIKFGAPGGQGSMPGFADKLSDAQVIDVIAWFQERWPDAIYATWSNTQMHSHSSN
jgi:mono/diheme cytochrome c family protein